MATLPANPGASLHQEALPDFILIRTDETDLGDRLRPIDPVWAKALGQMMARDGQDTPVQVCRLPGRNRWTIVAGGHRLVGAQGADIEYLRAEVVSADRDARRMREVRENLWRSDLTPIDRAAFIAEAVAIYKRRIGVDPSRDGRAASVAVRWSKRELAEEAGDTTDMMSVVYGWSDKVGEQIGLGARTVRRDLELYRRLPASVVERLREARHPVFNNASQLRALAKLEPVEQASVVATLVGKVINGKTITSVAKARSLQGDAPTINPDNKFYSMVLSTLKRMSDRDRVALFQSPEFHNLVPAEARSLLAPMRRDPQLSEEPSDAEGRYLPADRRSHQVGLAGHGEAVRKHGAGSVSEHRVQRDNQDASVATIKMRIAWGCGGAGRSPEPT